MRFALPIIIFMLLAPIAAAMGGAEEKQPAIDFDRDIRPILSDNCYYCHGPHAEHREGGDVEKGGLRFDTQEGALADLGDGRFAIVPGDPDRSELVRRILSTDEDEVMPPADHRKKLNPRQKRLLTEWIRQGATWSGQWAYAPLRRTKPPTVSHRVQIHNWIDNYILSRLEKENIKPSPPADKRVLLRRLYFDLIGLPPAPAEVKEFLSDSSADAWRRLVDRLLASPHYGERMAIYWLDLVRYADSVGYHGDQSVSVSPFRDYVIGAFNSNMPFDRFTREQLAGDLLPQPSTSQRIASGYNRLGMMSAEGGVQDKEYLAKYAADRVRTASAVWLGSTLGCAECHDHKFDPFTTKDFYRFAAIFADIKERGLYAGAHADGKWGPKIELRDERLESLLKPLDEKLAALEKRLAAETEKLQKQRQNWEKQLTEKSIAWQVLRPENGVALHGVTLKVLRDGSLLARGPNEQPNVYTVDVQTDLKGISGFRIEVLPHESLSKKGPGRGKDGNFVLTEFRVEAADPSADSSNTTGYRSVSLQNASASFEQTLLADVNPYKAWNAASVIDGDNKGRDWGWAVAPQTGRRHDLVVEVATKLHASKQGATRLRFHLDQNLSLLPGYTVGRFRISATTAPRPIEVDPFQKLPLDIQKILQVESSKRNEKQKKRLTDYYGKVAPDVESMRKEVAALKKRRQQTVDQHTRTSLITVAVEPPVMRVLPRGNWMDDSGEIVQPGVPHFLPLAEVNGRFNRLDLADWITAGDNPLTARVFVNRMWKLFFGVGLSKVLDDVGSQGEAPSHPELLDALSIEFMESGWNVKHLVRLLVTSATYRRSSLPRDDLRTIDPYNRLLARQSRYRLDAEMIRDNALRVSGLLQSTIGGESAKPYQPEGLYRHLNFPKRTYKHDSNENQYRRGVYTHWQRQYLHPAMKTFDAPPREECAAQRPRSNTPLAALVLLNDPSYVEAARVFAERALREIRRAAGDATRARIDWIMQQALSRKAGDREYQVLSELLQSQRKRFANRAADAEKLVATGLQPVPSDLDKTELAAWTAVTRTVFNLHEFITRN